MMLTKILKSILHCSAFLLPIMERILQRGGGRVQLKPSSGRAKASSVAATKGLILTPTRELAAQCLGMMTAMAKYTGLRALLIVGGAKNVNAQVSEKVFQNTSLLFACYGYQSAMEI